MQTLIKHIENLLIEHDCVVVPGLGGFLHQEQAAYYDEVHQLYFPSGKTLSFNAKLHFNDGLLCQEYQYRQSLSFEAANQQIRQAVAEIKDYLSKHQQLSFGAMGSFSQLPAQPLVFTPAMTNTLHPEAFGLKACSKPMLQPKQTASSGTHTHWTSYVTAVAACLLLLFTLLQDNMLLQPRTSLPRLDIQEAAVLPLCSLRPSVESLPAPMPVPTASWQEPKQESRQATTHTSSQTVLAETKSSAALSSKDIVHSYPSAEKQYLIVIASFPNVEQAEQYIKSRQLQDKYPSLGIAVGSERCRVYAESYQDREEALFFLSEFRASNPKYAKAWVLVH